MASDRQIRYESTRTYCSIHAEHDENDVDGDGCSDGIETPSILCPFNVTKWKEKCAESVLSFVSSQRESAKKTNNALAGWRHQTVSTVRYVPNLFANNIAFGWRQSEDRDSVESLHLCFPATFGARTWLKHSKLPFFPNLRKGWESGRLRHKLSFNEKTRKKNNLLSQQIQYIYWFAIRMWYIWSERAGRNGQTSERDEHRPSEEKLIICFRSFGLFFSVFCFEFIRLPWRTHTQHTPEARTKLPSIHLFIAAQNKFIYFVAFIPPSAERAFASSCARRLCCLVVRWERVSSMLLLELGALRWALIVYACGHMFCCFWMTIYGRCTILLSYLLFGTSEQRTTGNTASNNKQAETRPYKTYCWYTNKYR